MNDQTPRDELPELSDETIARIETSVFSAIAAERPPAAAPSAARARTRRRRWLTGAGIAAAFVVGVLVTPPILGAVGGGSMMTADGAAWERRRIRRVLPRPEPRGRSRRCG